MRITPELLKERKKEIIQAECHGLLEFIEPVHNLDAVAGHGKAKQREAHGQESLVQRCPSIKRRAQKSKL